MKGASKQVEFKVKDPYTGIIWLRKEFNTIPAFHRWLKDMGFTDSYSKIYNWLKGNTGKPIWFNEIIYEVETFSGGGVENLKLELLMEQQMEEAEEIDEKEVNAIFY